MPKVTINDSKGLLVEAGNGFVVSSTPTFTVTPIASLQTQTAATTIQPGVHAVSGSQGVITLTLPQASTVPGGVFIVRSNSPSAHVLTGSDPGFVGTRSIVAPLTGSVPYAGPQQVGSRLTFSAAAGNSVVLVCDGRNFLVTSQSGSFTYGG